MEKYKKVKNDKFNISAPTWNEKFKLLDESHYVSDIQDYFEYIFRIHEAVTDNASIRIHINKMKNRITFKIKTGYGPDLLTPETMKLLGSTKSKITEDENDKNVPRLEITEVVLIHCNILTTIISKIQESCIHLCLISQLVNY